MITDDPKEMEQRLTQYVKDAREALETLEAADPDDTVDEKSEAYRTYIAALNKLNTARVWLGIAADQLQDLLNLYNDRMIDATKEAREVAEKERRGKRPIRQPRRKDR